MKRKENATAVTDFVVFFFSFSFFFLFCSPFCFVLDQFRLCDEIATHLIQKSLKPTTKYAEVFNFFFFHFSNTFYVNSLSIHKVYILHARKPINVCQCVCVQCHVFWISCALASQLNLFMASIRNWWILCVYFPYSFDVFIILKKMHWIIIYNILGLCAQGHKSVFCYVFFFFFIFQFCSILVLSRLESRIIEWGTLLHTEWNIFKSNHVKMTT